MISDVDIYRAALVLIEQHKADAEIEAAQTGQLMLERGDLEGALHWFRIQRAIQWLQNLPSTSRH